MTRGDLPDEVRRFILTSIPSIPYLEALLLLHAGGEPAGWDASRVARRLYVADKQAGELLTALAAAGIASADASAAGVYHYRPATAELSERVNSLAAAYATNLLAVTDLVHSRLDKRAHQFADAFRLRKDS
jgi:hypothetical protein